MQSSNQLIPIDPIGFGTNGIRDKEIISTAIEQGYRLFDTADSYRNATEIAEALTESGIPREQFFINYKIMPKLGKEKFLQHVDEAIKKFGYIDCLMLHDRILEENTSIEEILESLTPYLHDSRIRHLGLSNFPDTIRVDFLNLLKQFPQIKFLQNKFDHMHQDKVIRDICKENGVQYMGYELFGGKPSVGECGQYAYSIFYPTWHLSSMIFPEFHQMAEKYNTTPFGMLMAYALLENTVQIPSSTKKENMAANLAAKQIASVMTNEDKVILKNSLTQAASTEEWEKIKTLAKQGDRLSKLKYMAGNYLPRHRILEMLYQEHSLKHFFDMILDDDTPQGIYVTKDNRVNSLLHFLEETLRAGNVKVENAVNAIQMLTQMSTTKAGQNGVFEIISMLGAPVLFEDRYESLNKYLNERQFLKKEGYLDVKMIDMDDRDEKIVFITSDKKVYAINNISPQTSISDFCNLLVKNFPDDFKDIKIFETLALNNKKINLSSISRPLTNTNFSSGDIVHIGEITQPVRFSNFYHQIDRSPVAFADPEKPVISIVEKKSGINTNIFENFNIEYSMQNFSTKEYDSPDFIKKYGYTKVAEILLQRDKGDWCVNTTIIGPNEKLYLLKNISIDTPVIKIADLLKKSFPDDFKDNNILDSFNINGKNITENEMMKTLANCYSTEILGIGGKTERGAFAFEMDELMEWEPPVEIKHAASTYSPFLFSSKNPEIYHEIPDEKKQEKVLSKSSEAPKK